MQVLAVQILCDVGKEVPSVRFRGQWLAMSTKTTLGRLIASLILVVLVAVGAAGCSTLATTTSPTSSGQSSNSRSIEQTVAVYLNGGAVEMFKYEGFANYPTSIRENGSCTSYTFSKGDVTEMQFLGRTTASCSSNNVYWEYSVVLNGRAITGHYGVGAGGIFSVSGTDLSTGRSKSVRYENIARIQFNR
jgi:hypothetical protein